MFNQIGPEAGKSFLGTGNTRDADPFPIPVAKGAASLCSSQIGARGRQDPGKSFLGTEQRIIRGNPLSAVEGAIAFGGRSTSAQPPRDTGSVSTGLRQVDGDSASCCRDTPGCRRCTYGIFCEGALVEAVSVR